MVRTGPPRGGLRVRWGVGGCGVWVSEPMEPSEVHENFLALKNVPRYKII